MCGRCDGNQTPVRPCDDDGRLTYFPGRTPGESNLDGARPALLQFGRYSACTLPEMGHNSGFGNQFFQAVLPKNYVA